MAESCTFNLSTSGHHHGIISAPLNYREKNAHRFIQKQVVVLVLKVSNISLDLELEMSHEVRKHAFINQAFNPCACVS